MVDIARFLVEQDYLGYWKQQGCMWKAEGVSGGGKLAPIRTGPVNIRRPFFALTKWNYVYGKGRYSSRGRRIESMTTDSLLALAGPVPGGWLKFEIMDMTDDVLSHVLWLNEFCIEEWKTHRLARPSTVARRVCGLSSMAIYSNPHWCFWPKGLRVKTIAEEIGALFSAKTGVRTMARRPEGEVQAPRKFRPTVSAGLTAVAGWDRPS